jgi:hypothetical protein
MVPIKGQPRQLPGLRQGDGRTPHQGRHIPPGVELHHLARTTTSVKQLFCVSLSGKSPPMSTCDGGEIGHSWADMDDRSDTRNVVCIQREEHVVARHSDARIARRGQDKFAIGVACDTERNPSLVCIDGVGR